MPSTAFRAAAKAAGFTLYQASNDSEMDADKKQDNTWWLDKEIDTKLDEKDE